MARRSRRRAPAALAAALALLAGRALRRGAAAELFAGPAPGRGAGRWRGRVALRAEEAEVVRSAALVKVEQDIETRLAAAEEAKDTKKITQLARLLVMAKASEGAAAWQATQELSETVGNEMAAALAKFVGKDDYDIKDVANEVDMRVGSAVSKLDNIYLDEEAARSAGATNPIILKDVVAPVVDNVKESTEGAVLAFTGKDTYEFGDISKEVDQRAKQAIASILGKEEYKFGDISKAAASKVMEGITSFTGKEEYKFGDITKTVLKNALNFLEGDKDKK